MYVSNNLTILFYLTFRLDKTNIEEKVISNTPSINEENCFVDIKEFASRLEINPDDEPTTGLFSIFLNVWQKQFKKVNFNFFLIFPYFQDSDEDVIDFREYLLSSLFLITLYKPKYNFVRVLFQVRLEKRLHFFIIIPKTQTLN